MLLNSATAAVRACDRRLLLMTDYFSEEYQLRLDQCQSRLSISTSNVKMFCLTSNATFFLTLTANDAVLLQILQHEAHNKEEGMKVGDDARERPSYTKA